MFTATRMAAGVAILALTGSLALIAGSLQPQTQPLPLGADSASPTPRADGAVTGAVRLGVPTYDEPVPVEGWTETRGTTWNSTWTSDDPRLAGDGTFVLNFNTYPAEDGSEVSAGWSELTMENEGGSWTSLVPTTGVGFGDYGRSAYWLDGAGGYEGLSVFTVQTLAWNEVGAPYYEFEAWIVPGDAHLTQMFE